VNRHCQSLWSSLPAIKAQNGSFAGNVTTKRQQIAVQKRTSKSFRKKEKFLCYSRRSGILPMKHISTGGDHEWMP
jgi:hypothetical protein